MIGAGFQKMHRVKEWQVCNHQIWSELAEKMYEELYPEPLEAQEKEEWNRQRIIKDIWEKRHKAGRMNILLILIENKNKQFDRTVHCRRNVCSRRIT